MGSDEGAAGARWRWEHAVVVVALGLWTLGFFAGLTETPWRAIDDDENTTIVQAELLAAGLPVRDATFQLLPSCGGCRLLTLGAWGLFSVFPPTVLTWKLLPLLFGLLAVGGAALAGWRLAGPRAGALAAVLTALPPPLYRELGQRAWGNHFEVTGLIALVLAASRHRTTARGAFLLGLSAALAASFAYSAAPVVLVVLGGACLTGVRWGGRGGGIAAGSLPWLGLRVAGLERWLMIYGRGSGQAWDPGPWIEALGAPWAGAMWGPSALGGGLAALGWVAFFSVPVWLLARGLRGRAMDEVLLGAAVVSHLVAFVVIGPGLPTEAPDAASDSFSWRYLAPLFPVIAVGAAVLARRGGPLGRVPAGALVLLGLLSFGSDLASSEFETRPLRMAAAHVAPGAHTGRVGADPTGPITFDFRRPMARRQILWESGLEAGRLLASGEEVAPSWWPWVRGRSDVERTAVLLGVAAGIHERRGLASERADERTFAAAVDELVPEELRQEARWARVWGRWGFAREGERTLPEWLGPWADGVRDAQAGRRADPAAGGEYARGYGEGVGALWGDEESAVSRLDSVPPGVRAQADAGLRRAREWVFPL